MRYDNSVSGRQLTLVLEEFELPTDETERNQFLDDLEAALEAVLTEYDLDAERLRAIDGHSYSAIDDCCPVCGDDLKLIAPSLDPLDILLRVNAEESRAVGVSGSQSNYRTTSPYRHG